MKTFASIAAVAALVGTVASLTPAAPKAQPGPQAAMQPLQAAGGLVQMGGTDPHGVTVEIAGTGTIDGTYRADRELPILERPPFALNPQQYKIGLVAVSGQQYPQAKFLINRCVDPASGRIFWNCGGWIQCAPGGYAADGTALVGEFPLFGTDPLTIGGTVSGSAPWGATGRVISVTVSP